MRITLRLFGHFRDAMPDTEEFHVAAGSTVHDVANLLETRDPRLVGLARHCRAAVNEEYAPSDTRLDEGDEVAFIPPMSGG